MRAAVVHEPGGPEVLRIEERAVPTVVPGWVLVRVRAFGLNRSELITRAGGSGDAVRFPRVLGIECVGEVADAGSEALERGQPVVAAMGGMGRDYDGGYEEFALLPAAQVIPVRTTLAWAQLGAIPETFGTAWGSLETLELAAGRTLLVRGATSSVGMAATTLAKDRGVVVIGTTRQDAKRAALLANGVDHAIIDDGHVAARVREIVPGGADALLELVGPATMADSFAALRNGARACLTGYLAEGWEEVARVRAEAARLGIALVQFGSNVIARASYADTFQTIVAGVESGRFRVNLDRAFPLDEIADAHRYMEQNRAAGKVVGLT
jgi:NADPH:quinone reductase-like Zn-dependent oxidoreductase